MLTKEQALETCRYWTEQLIWAYENLKWPEDAADVEFVEGQAAYWVQRAWQLGASIAEIEEINALLKEVA